MNDIYERNKDLDEFLYITYTNMEIYGDFLL